MSPAPTLRRRWRRLALATAGVSLLAAISPVVGAGPAAAATAPLVTTDGVGIRVDENAILGPALEAIEDELQPVVDQLITEGAIANSVMDDPDWVDGSADLELSFDFVDAGTAGYPQGGLKVHADLQDIRMRFYRYGAWWQPECLIYVEPDDGAIDASARIDTSQLPDAPLTLNPIDATWDDDPTAGPAPGYSWLCNGYLIDEWWDGLWGDGTDVAAQLEAQLNGQAQELVDDLWAEHVAPVIDSLTAFGITFNQVRTDDHGLIVTANVDATNGLAIPGDPSGPRDVSAAQDSGVTSDVNALLANRASDAIVTIHPNVANQFLYALTRAVSGQFGTAPIPDSIEDVLLDPAVHGDYADAGWTVNLAMTGTAAPFVQPTGPGGAPEAVFDPINVVIRNSSKGTAPVAVFRGEITAVGLDTVVRPGSDSFGPAYDPSGASGTLTRINGNADVVAFGADPSVVLPYAGAGIDYFDEAIFQQYASLAPIEIGGLAVDLCTACGRYAGDQRYTETFTVG